MLPSSVPTHRSPGTSGDSVSDAIALQELTPSLRERMHSWPRSIWLQRGRAFDWPMISTRSRSTFFDRSGLIVHVSPRSIDLNSRLPPAYTTSGLWGERMKGVFQFQRISVSWSGMGTMFDEGLFSLGTLGRMLTCSPVARLRRRMLPFWDSE